MKDYVKVFRGHDVPYGATKYQEDTERFHESFWDNDGNVWVIGISKKWVKSASVAPENLIPLPEEPMPSKSEWMPEAGDECIVDCPYQDGRFAVFNGLKVTVLGVYDDGAGDCVVTAKHDVRGFVALTSTAFRKLKTPEEKKREAFIEGVKKLFPKSDADDLILVAKLFGAGYTAPEGEL